MKINGHDNISIALINERHEILSYYKGSFRDVYDHYMEKIMTSLEDPFNPEYPFLTTIDEYDNTFYNWYQVLKLIKELERLADEDKDTEFKNAVTKVIEYLNTATSLHYIHFIGD